MTAMDISQLGRWSGERMRTVLRVNAAFSALSAAVLLGSAGSLAEWLEVPAGLVVAIGIGLAGFAAYVAWAARRETAAAGHVSSIAIADLTWVAAAIVVVLIPGALPFEGKVALSLVSVVVLDLGMLEWMGRRHLAPASAS